MVNNFMKKEDIKNLKILARELSTLAVLILIGVVVIKFFPQYILHYVITVPLQFALFIYSLAAS